MNSLNRHIIQILALINWKIFFVVYIILISTSSNSNASPRRKVGTVVKTNNKEIIYHPRNGTESFLDVPIPPKKHFSLFEGDLISIPKEASLKIMCSRSKKPTLMLPGIQISVIKYCGRNKRNPPTGGIDIELSKASEESTINNSKSNITENKREISDSIKILYETVKNGSEAPIVYRALGDNFYLSNNFLSSRLFYIKAIEFANRYNDFEEKTLAQYGCSNTFIAQEKIREGYIQLLTVKENFYLLGGKEDLAHIDNTIKEIISKYPFIKNINNRLHHKEKKQNILKDSPVPTAESPDGEYPISEDFSADSSAPAAESPDGKYPVSENFPDSLADSSAPTIENLTLELNLSTDLQKCLQ